MTQFITALNRFFKGVIFVPIILLWGSLIIPFALVWLVIGICKGLVHIIKNSLFRIKEGYVYREFYTL